MWVGQQRSEDLCGGGGRGRTICVGGGGQGSDDRWGEGSKGRTIGVGGSSRGRTIYMGRAAEVVGGSVWRRRQRSEGRCVGLEGGAKVTRC
jgi:hypothetical protein